MVEVADVGKGGGAGRREKRIEEKRPGPKGIPNPTGPQMSYSREPVPPLQGTGLCFPDGMFSSVGCKRPCCMVHAAAWCMQLHLWAPALKCVEGRGKSSEVATEMLSPGAKVLPIFFRLLHCRGQLE